MPDAAIDIIIVSYNCREVLDACLRSLANAPPRRPCRIVVVDNGSTDGTVTHLHAQWPQVQVIASGGNRGFAAGNNVGIRASQSPLVLLLNPDTSVPAGAIDTLASALDDDRRAAVAAPRIVDANGRAELSFGSMLGPNDSSASLGESFSLVKTPATLTSRWFQSTRRRPDSITSSREAHPRANGFCS